VTVVRLATVADAAAVHAVTQAAYADYAGRLDPPSGALRETEDQVAADLAVGGLVADAGGAVVGALRFRRGSGGTLWVRRVSVAPAHRRRGLARLLLRAAEVDARRRGATRLRLGVRHVLPANRRLYEREGWVPLRRHDFWDEMARPLPLPVASPAAMRELGARLAREVVRAGDLVLLDGPLGAGKTVFAQGVARGLDIDGPVRSPTYTLVDSHGGGRVPLMHLDAWRLGGPGELDDLDLEPATETAVTLVEWGVGRAERLAAARLVVRVVPRDGADGSGGDGAGGGADDDEAVRDVLLTPVGGDWAARLAAAGLL